MPNINISFDMFNRFSYYCYMDKPVYRTKSVEEQQWVFNEIGKMNIPYWYAYDCGGKFNQVYDVFGPNQHYQSYKVVGLSYNDFYHCEQIVSWPSGIVDENMIGDACDTAEEFIGKLKKYFGIQTLHIPRRLKRHEI